MMARQRWQGSVKEMMKDKSLTVMARQSKRVDEGEEPDCDGKAE